MTKAELATAKAELGIAVPSFRDVFGRRAATFDALVEQLRAAQELKKQAEMEERDLKAKLETYFADSDSKTLLSGLSRVTLVLSHNSHVSKELLLEKGVPADTIIACTKKVPYSFVKVTAADKE